MLGGGVWAGTSTLVLGPSGAGKTMLALDFAAAGARAGRRTVFATLQESVSQLTRVIQGGARAGLSDHLEIHRRSPVDMYIDEWVHDVLGTVQRTRAELLVVDSLSDLRLASPDETRFEEYVYSFGQRCSRNGTTALMTLETRPPFAFAGTFSTSLSHIADNVLLIGYSIDGSEVRRAVHILKSRGSAHDQQIYEYTLAGDGVHVGEPITLDVGLPHLTPDSSRRDDVVRGALIRRSCPSTAITASVISARRRSPPATATARPPAASGGGRFVVQRHRATRLHYDFRLEIGGLLASWAIPKGPTLDPAIRRMAVHVEDHPIEYFDFEGVIPRGQYGAGDVIVWDWGTFVPEAETPDPVKAVEDGELKFELHGEKLRGRFTIVRTSRRPGSAPTTAFEDDSEQWLLIKKRDTSASAGWDAEDLPQSVKTGRTNDEVQAKREALWMSDMPAAAAEIDLEGAVEAPLKGFIQPMLATLATNAFDDPDWLFEIKWDGYRLQAVVQDGAVRTFTRRGLDGATYFPGLLANPSWIAAQTAVVDGEVVAVDEQGVPDFPLLQEAISESRSGSRGSGGKDGRDGAAEAATRAGSSTRRSTCSTSTAARCFASRSRIGSGSSGASCANRRASGTPPTSRATAGRSTRRPASAGSRASWPSSAARPTSRVAGRRPG